MNKKEISVSILDCDFNKLKNEINSINSTNCDYIHIDVMDGSFVPSKAFDFKTIKKVNLYSKKKLDYHLMVNDPINYIEKCSNHNAEIISIHYEENVNIYNDLISIKKLGCKAGLAINPNTKISDVASLFKEINILLLMSVQPGKGGQKFLENTFDKILEANQIINDNNLKIKIEVDGGIDNKFSTKLFDLGASILVSGNFIINNSNKSTAVSLLRQ